MYVFKVVVGVDLINEFLYKLGEGGGGRLVEGGVFKPFKKLDTNNTFFKQKY